MNNKRIVQTLQYISIFGINVGRVSYSYTITETGAAFSVYVESINHGLGTEKIVLSSGFLEGADEKDITQFLVNQSKNIKMADVQKTFPISIEDITAVATQMRVTLSIEEKNEVLKYYPDAQKEDSSATWNLVVEQLIDDVISNRDTTFYQLKTFKTMEDFIANKSETSNIETEFVKSGQAALVNNGKCLSGELFAFHIVETNSGKMFYNSEQE